MVSAVLLLIVRGLAGLFGDPQNDHGLGEAIGNIVALVLVLVMITATLLTMADRKWSALMQDRVGPNRARLPIPGLRHREGGPLAQPRHRQRSVPVEQGLADEPREHVGDRRAAAGRATDPRDLAAHDMREEGGMRREQAALRRVVAHGEE